MTEAKPKRVLFAAYYFPPRGGAGVQRSLKFVKYLRRFGWEPTVLTTEYPPRSGAYDESLLEEIPPGTRVVRVPGIEGLFVKLGRMGLGRLTGLTVRPDFAVTWVNRALDVARRLHREEPFDAAYTSVQPWSIGLLGLRMKKEFGLPWLSDFRDPWTRSLHLSWPTKFHWQRDFQLERRYLIEADATVMVTETMRDTVLADHPDVERGRVSVVPNGYDVEDMAGGAADEDGKFTIVYAGKFQHDWREKSSGQGFMSRLRKLGTYGRRDVMLDTHSPIYFLEGLAKFLEANGRRARVRVVFAGIAGDGNKRLVERLGLDDVVECPGYLPHSESVGLIKSADALLLPMFSVEDENERVPYASGKVYEYMASGRPILALAPAGDARDTALSSGLAIAAAPRDVPAIAKAIETLYDEWKKPSGRFAPDDAYIAGFSRERLTGSLAAILDEVAQQKGKRR